MSKISYAAITSKNVATDSTSYISIPASQSNNVTSPTIKNNQKPNNNNNNNSNSPNFNSKTGDFPVLTENKPAAEFFPAEPANKTNASSNKKELSPTSGLASTDLNESSDQSGFREKTRRRSDRSTKNNNTNKSNSNYSNNKRFQNNKSSASSSNKRNAGQSGSAKSGSSNQRPPAAAGDKKPFAELLEEETKRLQQKYQKEPKSKLCFEFIKGDLFLVEPDVSLAHCVSEDFRMSKGIATEFRKRFNNVDQLLSQNVKTGGCAYIKHDDRHVFYMVTKKYYNHKPYYYCVENSLKALLKLCQELNITKLAMPMIATGLDKLDWDLVSRIIDDVFSKSNITLSIYKFESNNNNGNNNNNNRKRSGRGPKPASTNDE